MKITVLCGGTSTERDVSLTSGSLICKALKEKGHEVVLLDVYLGLKDVDMSTVFTLGENGLYRKSVVSEQIANIEEIKLLREDPEVFFGPNVLNICKASDIVFMALHGENGENGKVQAAFDLLGIKYTGTGYEGSMIAMSKDLTRKMLIPRGVRMAKGLTITKEQVFDDIKMDLFVPAVVKPSNGGSSVGVSIATDMDELRAAVRNAREYDDTVVVEEYIRGREFSVGVMEGNALPIIEIIPKFGFYDYKNKYQAGMTDEICPANLNPFITTLMQKEAEKAYKALGLNVYARIDFMLSSLDNLPYCLEANTLPGMTPTSLLPQEARAAGIEYGDLCEKIIEISLRKYSGKVN